jgi:hypothetical protein
MLSFLKTNKLLIAGIILGLIILSFSKTRKNYFEAMTPPPVDGNKHDANYDAATKQFCDAIKTQMQKENMKIKSK